MLGVNDCPNRIHTTFNQKVSYQRWLFREHAKLVVSYLSVMHNRRAEWISETESHWQISAFINQHTDFRKDFSLVKSMLFICEFVLEVMLIEFKLPLVLPEGERSTHQYSLFLPFSPSGSSGTPVENMGLLWAPWDHGSISIPSFCWQEKGHPG